MILHRSFASKTGHMGHGWETEDQSAAGTGSPRVALVHCVDPTPSHRDAFPHGPKYPWPPGSQVLVSTPDGRQVAVQVPAGVQPGQMFQVQASASETRHASYEA